MMCPCEFHQGQMARLGTMISSVHTNLEPLARRLWVHYASAEEMRDKDTIQCIDKIFKLLPKDDDAVSLEKFAKIYSSLFPIKFVSETLLEVGCRLKIRPLAGVDQKISYFTLALFAIQLKSQKEELDLISDMMIKKQVERFLSDYQDEIRLLTPDCSPELAALIYSFFDSSDEETFKARLTRENILPVLEQATYSNWNDIIDLCLDWIKENMQLSLTYRKDGALIFCSTTLSEKEAADTLNFLQANHIEFDFTLKNQNDLSSLLQMILQLKTPNIDFCLKDLDLDEKTTPLLLEIIAKSQVKILKLNNCNISLENMIHIAQAIQKSSSIQSLQIDYRSITVFESQCLHRDARMRKALSQREQKSPAQLEKSWNERFAEDAVASNELKATAYADMIRDCKSLKSLTLCDQSITHPEKITQAILNKKTLRNLHIEFHHSVKNSGIILSKIANKCRSLIELRLTDKNLSDEGANELIESVKEQNPGLQTIELSQDSFHRKAIASFHGSRD